MCVQPRPRPPAPLAFVHRVHAGFLVAIALGLGTPSAEGVVPSPFGRALEMAVVHGHTQVMALLLWEGPVGECAGDLVEARESRCARDRPANMGA